MVSYSCGMAEGQIERRDEQVFKRGEAYSLPGGQGPMNSWKNDTDLIDDAAWYRPLLGYGERVLWQGKPERFSLLEKHDWYLIPLSLFWGGFAIYWELSVIRINAPLLFKLWGIPFVCVGLYLMVGRFFYKRFILRHTVYAITDRRILRRAGKKIDMLERGSLPVMQVEYKEDGSGTIRFASSGPRYLRYHPWCPEGISGFALVGLSDMRQALTAIETMCQSRTD